MFSKKKEMTEIEKQLFEGLAKAFKERDVRSPKSSKEFEALLEGCPGVVREGWKLRNEEIVACNAEITRLRALLRKCEREVKRLCLSEEATDTEGNETWERARALHAKLKTELEAAG